jgi:hypothetical protein
MSQTVKPAVMMYTEQTPNPESLKYVTNRMIYQGTADFKTAESAAEWSPLAHALFAMPYVKGVYISNNFVTVSKELNYQWEDIMLPLKAFIKEYLESGMKSSWKGMRKPRQNWKRLQEMDLTTARLIRKSSTKSVNS